MKRDIVPQYATRINVVNYEITVGNYKIKVDKFKIKFIVPSHILLNIYNLIYVHN